METPESNALPGSGDLYLARRFALRFKSLPTIAFAVGVAVFALAASGCRGSWSSSGVANVGPKSAAGASGATAGGDGSQGAGGSARLLHYAECMRAHGVSNFPDPSASGPLAISKSVVSSPQYAAASHACESLAPAGAVAHTNSQLQTQLLTFARCMREHGVANFPDPNGSGAFALPSSVKNSPRYDAAQRACRSLEPGGSH